MPKSYKTIIVLDLDGVLTTPATMFRCADPACVAVLNRLLAETKAQIVVSSAWRTTIGETAALLAGWGVRGRVIGVTPRLCWRDRSLGRGHEIQAWLGRHHGVGQFVILDDDDDMGHLAAHLVQTQTERGLTEAETDRARAMLAVPPP